MLLRAGLHFVISPVQTTCSSVAACLQAATSTLPLFHDHCQYHSSVSRRDLEEKHKRTSPSGVQDKLASSLSFQDVMGNKRSISCRTNHNYNSILQQRPRIIGSSSIFPATTSLVPPSVLYLVSSNRPYSSKPGGDDTNNLSPPKPPPPSGSATSNSNNSKTNSSPLVVTIKDGLESRDSAENFLTQLTEQQKQLIYHTLNIEILRDKYEGHLGSSMHESHHYLSRFGRPATAKEDPTGTLCEVSPRWLHARLDEKAPPAPASAIWAVAVKNALPFIGFGFLDNLIMILAGDYIDITIGTALGISTMAAAALGNAISDVAGIGSAWYVEEFAQKIGIKDPDLTPSQMASGAVRWACNLGRAFGVLLGCILGMFPLLFLPTAAEVKERHKTGDEDTKKKDDTDKKNVA